MTGDYLLDTNAIIYALNGELTLPEAHYSVSTITEMELLSFPGLPSHEAASLRYFLNQMVIFPLDQPTKERAIEIRRNTSLKLPDSIISATAIIHGKCLVSNDKKLTADHPGTSVTLQEMITSPSTPGHE